MPNHQKEQLMNHQLNELTEVIQQTINLENTKARLDVFSIIEDGKENGKDPVDILIDLLKWCKR
jgi:hypothetical protein